MPASQPLPTETSVLSDLDIIAADIDSLIGNLSQVYGKPFNVPPTMSAAVREDLARMVQVAKVLGAGIESIHHILGHRQNFAVMFNSLLPISSTNPFNSQPGDSDPFDDGTKPLAAVVAPLQISTAEETTHDHPGTPATS